MMMSLLSTNLSGDLMVMCDTYIYQVVFIINMLCTFSAMYTVLCRFSAVLDRRIEQAWVIQPKNAPRDKQVMRRPRNDPPPSAALAAK